RRRRGAPERSARQRARAVASGARRVPQEHGRLRAGEGAEMRPREDDLVRWRETSMDPSALPARAADLADAARDVAPLPREALARIKVDVVARRPSRGRGLPLGLRVAVLSAIVLASIATARGTMRLWRRFVVLAEPITISAPARHHAAPRPTPEPRVETAPVIEALDEAPAPMAAPSNAPRRRVAIGER